MKGLNNKEKNIYDNEYARVYVILQKYENLFNVSTALRVGTIFKDLYRDYMEKE